MVDALPEKPTTHYCGRFAPSPTGPLHFGSMLAATASYLEARKQQGRWLLRIEDIDPPREQPGAADSFLHTLSLFGFEWDALSYQSQRLLIYKEYLEQLTQQRSAYTCGCTRNEIRQLSQNNNHPIYPGTCRNGLAANKTPRSIRVNTPNVRCSFNDIIRGPQSRQLDTHMGDYIVQRADGLISYQLAVAVDDSLQNISQVVRGGDLLESSFCQIHLQQLLGLNTPEYAHLPMATHRDGSKLSKQTFATAVPTTQPGKILWELLNFLGQQPPNELRREKPDNLWQWAITNWTLGKIPVSTKIVSPIQ